jgi:hypothetical protein
MAQWHRSRGGSPTGGRCIGQKLVRDRTQIRVEMAAEDVAEQCAKMLGEVVDERIDPRLSRRKACDHGALE